MKTTVTGYRITNNGVILISTEKEALTKDSFCGNMIKEEGVYYFFDRKQGETYVYLP